MEFVLLRLMLVYQFLVYGSLADGVDESSCPGLHKLANAFAKPPALLGANAHLSCTVDKGCKGLHCSGLIYNERTLLSLQMEHCKPPMSVRIHFQVPSKHVDAHNDLVDGHEYKVQYRVGPGILTITTTPHFVRTGDNVKMTLNFCGALGLGGHRRLNKCLIHWPVSTTFNIKQELCGVKVAKPSLAPGPVVSTAHISHDISSRRPSGQPDSTKERPWSWRPSIYTRKRSPTTRSYTTRKHHSHTGGYSTGRGGTTDRSGTTDRAGTTQRAGTTGEYYTGTGPRPTAHAKQKGRKDKTKGLSRGGKVAIIASAGLILFVLIGLLFYCKKYRQRRPAFYNDIAINDPLRGEMYDGDEEPLFNSHLVL